MKHVKQAIVTVAMIVALAVLGEAQIGVPYTFSTSVPVSQLNTNLSTIADGALKRNGGNITGNITVDSGITIDGVDIGAVWSGSGNPTFATMDLSDTGAEALDVAGGAEFGTSNIELIGTDGKLKGLSGTYLADLSAAALTGLPSTTGITTTWNAVSYSGSNFTTNGAGGWTVDAGDVSSYRWMKIGKTMYVQVVLLATTVTAATGTQLRIAIPDSGTAAALYSNPVVALNNGVATTSAFWQVAGGDTYITVFNEGTAATAWTASANATQLRFTAVFEVQ